MTSEVLIQRKGYDREKYGGLIFKTSATDKTFLFYFKKEDLSDLRFSVKDKDSSVYWNDYELEPEIRSKYAMRIKRLIHLKNLYWENIHASEDYLAICRGISKNEKNYRLNKVECEEDYLQSKERLNTILSSFKDTGLLKLEDFLFILSLNQNNMHVEETSRW